MRTFDEIIKMVQQNNNVLSKQILKKYLNLP